MKRSPFAYGRKVDRTIFWLFFAIVLAIPMSLMLYIRPRDRRPEYDDQRPLKCKTTLMMLNNEKSNVVMKKGEKVTILGHVTGSYYDPFMLWVETSDGCRGHIPLESIDDRVVISPEYSSDADEESVLERHRGDTAKIVKWVEHGDYEVKFSNGETAKIDCDNLITMFASDKRNKINHDKDSWRPMSQKKFESIYMTDTFEKTDSTHLPAYYLIKRSNGSAMAAFPVRVFKDGKFYVPIINYDNDGKPTEYSFPEQAESRINESILKVLPFYGSVCDLPFVWPIFTEGIYQTMWQAPHADTLMKKILNYLLFLPLLLIAILFPPLIIPLILFGLLRFRVFKNINNARMSLMLKFSAFILTVLWWFLLLSGAYLLIMAIGSIIVLIIFNRNTNKVLDRIHPTFRCPDCTTLYSIEFDRTVEEGERTRALEEKEYLEKDVVTDIERWQTWTEVTTTYSNGSTSKSRENVQNHQREHGIRTYGIYNELAEYIHYTTYYICKDCGHIEKKFTTERVVLSRTKIRGYQERY